MRHSNSSLTLRALSALLRYPDAELRAACGEIASALTEDAALSSARLAELESLLRQIARMDPFEVEARYVETFDRGRSSSLHLFEHVHGDSRERGPALVDLGQTYERAGLVLAPGELPDYLPVVLEFASTQPADVAGELLSEISHIVKAIFSALHARANPYATVLAAVLELAGERVEAVAIEAEPALDEAWAEPAPFGGCSSRGQAKPSAPQPVHIIRRNPAASDPTQAASQRRLA
jgi:nitrate reductase delta subunit